MRHSVPVANRYECRVQMSLILVLASVVHLLNMMCLLSLVDLSVDLLSLWVSSWTTSFLTSRFTCLFLMFHHLISV